MVILDEPTFPGCEIAVRPIAVFWMTDEKGPDAKILMVPARDPRYAGLQNLGDVPDHVTAEIGHFFDIYKELERDKSTDVRGWQDRAAAETIIAESFARAAEDRATEDEAAGGLNSRRTEGERRGGRTAGRQQPPASSRARRNRSIRPVASPIRCDGTSGLVT